jgi:hypothetical protein
VLHHQKEKKRGVTKRRALGAGGGRVRALVTALCFPVMEKAKGFKNQDEIPE